MKMTPEIKVIIEDGKTVYLAPERTEICIKLDFRTKRTAAAISDPYLVRYGVKQDSDWGEFFRHTMQLRLGRYVQLSELTRLKERIRQHVNTVRAGYYRGNDRSFAEFDDSALEGMDQILQTASEFSFEYTEGYCPDAAFAETLLNMSDSDLYQLSVYPSSTLRSMAIDYSKRCYPHMHPWDAYQFLVKLQQNLKENYFPCI